MPHVYQAFRCVDRAKPAGNSKPVGPCTITQCSSAKCAAWLAANTAFAAAVTQLQRARHYSFIPPLGGVNARERLILLNRTTCNPHLSEFECAHEPVHCLLRGALGRLAPNLERLHFPAPAESVDPMLCHGLTKLVELRLDCCGILRRLPQKLLNNMLALRSFYVGHNELTTLPPNSFIRAPNVQWLHVAVRAPLKRCFAAVRP